ncbi:hypothetical protein ID866_3251 [Astraeus odoratus]|nr:hypothetical protein ID866_3251 [Astraeus odoratus]
MEKLPRMKHARKHCIRGCSGYQKILKCCCIDKRSSSEIHDHDEPTFPIRSDIAKYHDSGGWPRWFSRGWTLQELVAPKAVHFFNKNWEPVGNKHSLASVLNNITRVPSSVLEKGLPSKRPSVAQIISWAADRRTTREEDRAYSLLGLLGVHMPMLYGEGKNAFRRLQLEIIKMSNDHSIFAWGHSRKTGWSSSFLADDPSCFRDCSNVIIMEQDEFVEALKKDMKEEALLEFPRRRLRVFTVTNNGIHIWLPVVPCSGSTHFFIAKLACRLEEPCSRPLTITLGLFQSNHFRYFCYFATSCKAPAQFQELLLPSDYSKEENITNFVFKLDLACISHEDFIWHHSLPEDVIYKGDSLILTNTNSFAIIVYKHIEKDVFFALILSSCHGRHMARVIDCDGTQTFDRIQVDTLEEAFRVPEECANDEDSFVQHTHFPGSIQGARMIYRRLPGMKNACRITIDIVQCTGCCAPWKNGDIQVSRFCVHMNVGSDHSCTAAYERSGYAWRYERCYPLVQKILSSVQFDC